MKKTTSLIEHGQSFWLDDLSREMLDSGALKQRVEEEGLRGVTSNPSTFAASIQETDKYDTDIRRMREQGNSTEEIYEALMVGDVARACDVLKPVYIKSDGVDGFVSIEVDPRIARHTKASLEAARRLYAAVDRPNCMIKIPGTLEGLPAIESALSEGINVNITLLFSLKRYRQVVAAYQKAMDRRKKAGERLDNVASVASFFLSRIDVLVDELLDHRSLPDADSSLAQKIRGRMAVCSAQKVYKDFREFFDGPAWQSLEVNGARVQRPLWASTSTKDPHYSETLYVDSLIAKDTVNTMPGKTVDAFNQSGTLKSDSIADHADTADDVIKEVQALGIDLDYVNQRLEDEGIQKFIDSFDEGRKSIEQVN